MGAVGVLLEGVEDFPESLGPRAYMGLGFRV